MTLGWGQTVGWHLPDWTRESEAGGSFYSLIPFFPCLFLSKPSRFLLFPTFPKCAIVSLVQSSNALPLCPIMCPIPPASNTPQSVRWSRKSVPFFVPVCPSFPGMHQGSHTHMESVKLRDKRLFCTLTRKEHRGSLSLTISTMSTDFQGWWDWAQNNCSQTRWLRRLCIAHYHSEEFTSYYRRRHGSLGAVSHTSCVKKQPIFHSGIGLLLSARDCFTYSLGECRVQCVSIACLGAHCSYLWDFLFKQLLLLHLHQYIQWLAKCDWKLWLDIFIPRSISESLYIRLPLVLISSSCWLLSSHVFPQPFVSKMLLHQAT